MAHLTPSPRRRDLVGVDGVAPGGLRVRVLDGLTVEGLDERAIGSRKWAPIASPGWLRSDELDRRDQALQERAVADSRPVDAHDVTNSVAIAVGEKVLSVGALTVPDVGLCLRRIWRTFQHGGFVAVRLQRPAATPS